MSSKIDFKLIGEESDKLGFNHFKYQQTYNGIAIEPSRLIVHTKNGSVESVNTVMFNETDLQVSNSSLPEGKALATALAHVKAEKYK